MDKVRTAALLAFHNFKKWPVNPRVYVVLVLLVGYIHSIVSPVGVFCAQAGYTVGPWLFPFLMAEPYSALMIMLGLILLFCDAPFIEDDQPYLILRSGRKAWAVGQILYVMAGCAVYFVTTYLISVLVILPYIGFEDGWGKVINTFCQMGIAKQYGIVLAFRQQINNVFGPVQATLLDLFLCWMIGVFLGLLLLLLNLAAIRSVGGIVTAGLSIFPLFVVRSDWWMHYISPVSWCSLSVVDVTGTTSFPSLPYAIGMLAGGILLFGGLFIVLMAHRDIEVLKSV